MVSVGTKSTDVLSESLGPFMTGIMLQQLLMGVLVVQAYDYFKAFENDPRYNKILVGCLLFTSLLQTVLDYVVFYINRVTHAGNIPTLDTGNWPLWTQAALTAVVGTMSHSFFLQKCFAVTRSKVILVGGRVAILGSLGAGFIVSGFWWDEKISQMAGLRIPMTLWLVSSAIISIFTSAILMAKLAQSQTTFNKTEAILIRIIRLSFTTSSFTTAVTITEIILYLVRPNQGWHLMPLFVLGKIYAISVLATLLSRSRLREIMEESPSQTMIMTATTATAQRADLLTPPSPDLGGIKVSTTQTYHVDRSSTIRRQSAYQESAKSVYSKATEVEVQSTKKPPSDETLVPPLPPLPPFVLAPPPSAELRRTLALHRQSAITFQSVSVYSEDLDTRMSRKSGWRDVDDRVSRKSSYRDVEELDFSEQLHVGRVQFQSRLSQLGAATISSLDDDLVPFSDRSSLSFRRESVDTVRVAPSQRLDPRAESDLPAGGTRV